MKKINKGIALAISLILCLSLNQAALNGLSNMIPQETNSFIAEEQVIKEAPGGVLIDFDDLVSGTVIGTHYDDVEFTPGYQTLDTTANIYYPPYSSPNIAYTNDDNNNITFTNHVSYVSFYVNTVWDYNIEVVAYTTTDLVIASVAVGVNVTNQFIELDVPAGVIHRLSLVGDPGFSGYISIDNLFYLEYVPIIDRTITFDDFEYGLIDDAYPGLQFSSDYRTWQSIGNIYYPPESGEFVAVSNVIDNWFVFEMPVQKVSLFLSTAIADYEIVVTAYTDQDLAIEDIPIVPNTPNQYIEFDSPLGRIHRISVSGIGVFYDHWTIDTLSFSVLDSPTPNLIDFESYSGPVGSIYPGLLFTPGFQHWDSSGSTAYAPHSGVNTIYSHEAMPNITFSFPVEFASFYISVSGIRNIEAHAYSESGILIQKFNITNDVPNQYVVLRSLLGLIHRITLVGDPGFSSFWSMDDLCYIEYSPGDNQLLEFDELGDAFILGSHYGDVIFTSGFQTINTSTNPSFPPQSGDFVIYSIEENGNITFANPKSYVSFYASTGPDYNLQILVFNEADVLIQSFALTPFTINQFVELYSVGGFIKRLQITGDPGYGNFLSIDSLYFEDYKETFEFLLDFEDAPPVLEDAYPHVLFPGFCWPWDSSMSALYPPNSGRNVAYSFESPPIIIFTIPIMYASFYISTPTDYNFEVLAFSDDDTLIFKTSVEPDSVNKLIEIYSEDSRINEIRFNGTAGYNSHWTIDDLYYAANMFTYDLDGDGLSYYDEMLLGTDPFDWDSDGDGYSDGEEVAEGTDPLNPDDYPIPVPEFGYITFSLFVPVLMVVVLLYRRRKK